MPKKVVVVLTFHVMLRLQLLSLEIGMEISLHYILFSTDRLVTGSSE
jgi:hypothetical protein